MQQHHSNPKHTVNVILDSVLKGTENQCREDSTTVMWSVLLAPVSRCDRED